MFVACVPIQTSYISIRLLCFEIIPSEEMVAGFQWYITQGVNLLLTKVDIEFSIL